MQIPILQPSTRDREFKQRDFDQISRIIYNWLFFDDVGHREIDRDVLGLDPLSSKGWQSMGVLHFLGLKKEFKGIFVGLSVREAIKHLEEDKQDFSQIVMFLSDDGLFTEVNKNIVNKDKKSSDEIIEEKFCTSEDQIPTNTEIESAQKFGQRKNYKNLLFIFLLLVAVVILIYSFTQ